MGVSKSGQLIRLAREDVGMSQSDLARAAHVQQPTISAYESGAKRPRAESLAKILKAAKTRPSIPLFVYADEIREAATRAGLTHVRVFGSAVRGTDTPTSDIDLVVSTGASTSLFDLGRFTSEVSELTGFPVDVLTETQLENAFFAHVRDEAVDL